MKTGKTLQELVVELDRQAASKKDYLADTRKLSMEATQNGVVLQGINGGLSIRNTAHQQLSQTLGIPKTYYDKMLTEQPDLLAMNVNRWLHAQPARKMVRTLDGGVRAFLSESYRPLDNLDLATAVLPKLAGLEAQVLSGEVTENRLYIKAVTARIQGQVKKDDVIQAGVVISNSEVGLGRLVVEALDYRLVCLNGMIREEAIRKTHVSRRAGNGDVLEDAREYFRDETRKADDHAFFLKVQDATGAMFDDDRFNRRLDQYREAGTRTIDTDPVKVVEVTAKKLGFTDAERAGVLQHLIRGGDLSAWGLANAVTRQAQDAEDYDRSVELEKAGGSVIELTPSEWKALAV
jgi:hypothetical protein